MPVRIQPRFIPPVRSEGSSLSREHRDGKVMPMGWQPRSDRQIALRVLGQVALLAALCVLGTLAVAALP